MNRSLAILLLAIIGCGSLELLQAHGAPLPEKSHKRWVRRRVSRYDPDLDIVEVKDVYYVRRPKKVVTNPISEDEMDRRMRCDFEPDRSECQGLSHSTSPAPPTTSTTDDSIDRRIRCDFDPTADDCKLSLGNGYRISPRSTTHATTTTTTTTDLPLLPELTEPEEEPAEAPEEEEERLTTTEADYTLPEENDEDPEDPEDADEADEDGADADEEDDYDTEDHSHMGSIDPSEWNPR
ncbi:probable serine/threonine-protein kinase mps1 isoform X1 [Drosophila subobscura]|uniref:probable serine/threonine-protein kinase mps1 isoform X1 n=1 Tax=Drosophila subobscura TaxID=7241 RepID=UPI00155A5001|nr:probable serine/threonine-protein kinase mps1 isoform X1 [Drosophila subobscura]